MNFPRFTAWMGSNSSSNKWKRVCGELTTKLLAAGVVADRRDLRLQYLPSLCHALTAPLLHDGLAGTESIIALMQDYLISRCVPFDLCTLANAFQCTELRKVAIRYLTLDPEEGFNFPCSCQHGDIIIRKTILNNYYYHYFCREERYFGCASTLGTGYNDTQSLTHKTENKL